MFCVLLLEDKSSTWRRTSADTLALESFHRSSWMQRKFCSDSSFLVRWMDGRHEGAERWTRSANILGHAQT